MDMPEDLSGLSDEKLEELSKKWEKEKKYYDALKSKAEAEAAANPSEMENAKTLAEQQKAIAEAQKATLKAELPDFSTKGPEGKITATDVNIECQVLAYRAVSKIVSYISEKIKKEHPTTKKVVICDRNDLNNYFSYKIFIKQLELLKTEYDGVLTIEEEEVGNGARAIMAAASLTGVSTVLSSIVDFASLFRTDVDIKGVDVEIVEEALIAELVKALKDKTTEAKKGIEPIYLPFRINVPDKFLTEISDLDKCRDEALKIIEDCKKNGNCQGDVDKLSELNGLYDKIKSALVSIDEKTGTSRLEKLIKGEILNTELQPEHNVKSENPKVENPENEENEEIDMLYVKVVKAGGNNQTKRRFWTNEIAHSGGAIVAYFLMDKNGTIKESENLYYLYPYQRFDESPKQLNNLN